MVASIVALGKGLLSCHGQTLNAFVPSEKKLCHRDHPPTSSLTVGGGISRFEDISNLKLAVEHNVVVHPKSTFPSHHDVTEFEMANMFLVENFMCLQDATSTLNQEAEIFCVDKYLLMIKESRETKDLKSAKIVHRHICAAGLEELETPGNHLVPMFVVCGSISYAQQAFNKIASLTEHAWTFLMQGYNACGEPDQTLSAFQAMQEDFSVIPSKFTYVVCLKACAKSTNLQRGHVIHAEVVRKGMEDDCFIGNILVDMYTKCLCYLEAGESFNRLPVQDVVSWNILLGGFAESGLNEEAIECCDQMYHDGVPFDAVSYAYIIKACCNIGAIDKVHQLHTEMAIQGYETSKIACSTLVDTYSKHGFLVEARDVFDALPYHDAIAWTALVAGYVEGDMAEDALKCSDQMQLEGITPDAVSFSFLVKASGILGASDKVLELHNNIVKYGFENDSYVRNSLIAAYFSCGTHDAALVIFDDLPHQDIVSWNVLITAYTEQGNAKEALTCWKQMRGAQVLPDAITCISSLKACGSTKALHIGREIHVVVVEEGFENDSAVANVLIDMYAKGGCLIDAQEMFEELPSKSVISWTALIAGYVENGLSIRALMCLESMRLDGVLPNLVTYLCSLKACCNEGDARRRQDLHTEIVLRGFDKELEIGNILIDTYASFGLMKEAQHLLNQQRVHDVVSWNALIAGYAQYGMHEEARDCFQQMQLEGVLPDNVTWNAVLTAYAEQGGLDNAFNMYGQMQEQGLLPDVVTYISIFKACGSAGALQIGRRVHAQVYPIDSVYSIVSNVLIDMYGTCGSMVEAKEVFDFVSTRNSISWNVLLANYARQGDHKIAIAWYEMMMREKHIKPDQFTLLNILTVCSHAGLVDCGLLYYRGFYGDIAAAATVEHHNALLDLLGRAGQLNEAVAMFDLLPAGPNFVSWSIVLGSFQKGGDADLGIYTLDCVSASSKDYSAFVNVCREQSFDPSTINSFGLSREGLGLIPKESHNS